MSHDNYKNGLEDLTGNMLDDDTEEPAPLHSDDASTSSVMQGSAGPGGATTTNRVCEICDERPVSVPSVADQCDHCRNEQRLIGDAICAAHDLKAFGWDPKDVRDIVFDAIRK